MSLRRSPRNASALSCRSFCARSPLCRAAHRRCEHQHGVVMRPTSAPSATRTLTRTDARPQLDSYDKQSARGAAPPFSRARPSSWQEPRHSDARSSLRLCCRRRRSATEGQRRCRCCAAGHGNGGVHTHTHAAALRRVGACVCMCASRRWAPSTYNPTARCPARVPSFRSPARPWHVTPVNEAPSSQHPL